MRRLYDVSSHQPPRGSWGKHEKGFSEGGLAKAPRDFPCSTLGGDPRALLTKNLGG